jgi:hypothetical protein
MLDTPLEETNLIIGRVTVRAMITQGLPMQFNTCEWNTMDFHIIERVSLLS